MINNNMKTLSINEFKECYKPICNTCTPFPSNSINNLFGNVIWDRREYGRIASNIRAKTIWTVIDEDDVYKIVSVIQQNQALPLIGYIVCEVPYHHNNIAKLQVIVDKE